MATGDHILTAATVAKKGGIIQSSRSLIIDIDESNNKLKFEFFDHERRSTISIKMDDNDSKTDSETDEDNEEVPLVYKKSHPSKSGSRNRKSYSKSDNQVITISGEEVLEWYELFINEV